jgi:hypothetical protein
MAAVKELGWRSILSVRIVATPEVKDTHSFNVSTDMFDLDFGRSIADRGMKPDSLIQERFDEPRSDEAKSPIRVRMSRLEGEN